MTSAYLATWGLDLCAGNLEPLALATWSVLCIARVDAGEHPCLAPGTVAPLAAPGTGAGGHCLVPARVRGAQGTGASASHHVIFVSKF